ncbi:MAG: short-chain fatty acid transporter [Flavobacteriales bacterium]|nr:short-chain fatty acid transporter [Flavobacteriales bacterium]|tara:strand:+ start:28012 stop:29382 length:1371 start_codon:yes stop_codon:yes gene_type:complete
MSFVKKFENIFRSILPSPFSIAILLTILTFVLALIFTENQNNQSYHVLNLFSSWENGIWNNGLLVFAFQMMLMLVLGHTLALTNSINSLISKITKFCTSTANAATIISFFTIIVSLFNWGLGLIFGAIFARKVAEHASNKNINLNYPLIGAAGYSGLMVWHGGISGSAPIKVAEKNHLTEMFKESNFDVPSTITLSETIFSQMNIFVSVLLLIIIPTLFFYLGKKNLGSNINVPTQSTKEEKIEYIGAEQLDHSRVVSKIISILILAYCFYKSILLPEEVSLKVITPNFINLILLGLGIFFHSSFYKFTNAITEAIKGASGILIQFPLYFGIMGIMKDSGMVSLLSDFFVNISNETTFPIFTFISAGIVNIFVPSGGGQWAIQGPIIIEAANQLGVSFSKSIMALAYGDQLTNMLQPFWALPLLGITGLKAREILPYTLYLFLIGCLIFVGGLLLF